MVCAGERCICALLSAIVAVLICLLLHHVLPAGDSHSSNYLASEPGMPLPNPPRSLPIPRVAHHAQATRATPARLPPHGGRPTRGPLFLASPLEFCVRPRCQYP